MMQLVFWWSIVTPHQSAYVRELAKDSDVVVVALEEMTPDRQALGWKVPDLGRARLVLRPSESDVARICVETSHWIHLVEGWRGCRLTRLVFRHAAAGARIGMISESGDPRGWRGTLRRVLYRVDAWRKAGRLDFILAMGSSGVNWYRACNVRIAKIFPFCYVAELPEVVSSNQTFEERAPFRIVYLGAFSERKGVDVLLNALALVRDHAWHAELVGSGPLEREIRTRIEALGLCSRVRQHNSPDRSRAMQILSEADLLVLPSRYDGWGAVVNEALMLGVPVICTSSCGASDLIQTEWLGCVVPPNSVAAMAEALEERITSGAPALWQRERIRKWARCIDGRNVASYMVGVLQHVYGKCEMPTPPWLGAKD